MIMSNFTELFDLNKPFHYAIMKAAIITNEIGITYTSKLGDMIRQYWRVSSLTLEEIIENICTDYDDADNTNKIYPYSESLYNFLRETQKLC